MYKLVKATDDWMTRSRISLPRGIHFYPSEGSAKWTDSNGVIRIAGACLRKSYFRCTGAKTDGPNTPYTEWIFALGKHVEEILVEQWKQMGIWVANNLKFYDPVRNVSGEIDVVLSDPDGKPFGVEVKSFYGYQSTRDICGNKSVQARPKTSQLMQTLIYVDQCKDKLDYFKMVYYARDSAARNEFDITLTFDAEKKVHRPTINGIIDYRFTLEDIYNRYDQLAQYILDEEVPAPDFELVWDPEKVEQRKALKEVSKTAYEKWQKNPGKYPIGDWQCRWCNYSHQCWPK